MMTSLKSNVERANYAKVFMYISLAATSALLITEIYQYFLIDRIVNEEYTLELMQEAEQFDLIAAAVGGIYLISFILTIIFFIMWFRRAYWNLHRLTKGLRYTEGWAAGAWFIPIFNWFGPYQIATDLFVKTEKLLTDNDLIESKPKQHSIRGWWWGLWITGNIIGNIDGDSTIEMIRLSTLASIISSVLTIAAGILAIQLIKNYHEMEVKLKNLEDVSQSNPANEELLDTL